MNAGLYVHIPFCEKKCLYCDFYSGKFNENIREAYVDELVREIEAVSKKCPKTIQTIYFGGGTPTVLTARQLEKISDAIFKNFKVDLKEFSIETNPNIDIDFKFLRQMGIDRISVGIQSLEDELLKKIGRTHTSEQAKECLEKAREYFDNISADLMLGLDEKQDVEADSDYLLKRVTHLSAYMLKLEDRTPLKHLVEAKRVAIATEDAVIGQYEKLCEVAKKYGFFRYEVSNFARHGYVAKHNSGYWDLSEYLGVGAAAHSYVDGFRYYNESSLKNYIKGNHSGNGKQLIEREFSAESEKAEYIMLSLRTTAGLNFETYKNRYNEDFLVAYATKIEKIKNYIDISDCRLAIKDQYFLVQNSIISELV